MCIFTNAHLNVYIYIYIHTCMKVNKQKQYVYVYIYIYMFSLQDHLTRADKVRPFANQNEGIKSPLAERTCVFWSTATVSLHRAAGLAETTQHSWHPRQAVNTVGDRDNCQPSTQQSACV